MKKSRRKKVVTIMGDIKKTGTYKGKSNKLGGGGRFEQVKEKAKEGGARNPGAVAAAIGRKKYGKKKFQAMAKKGRMRRKGSYRGGERIM